MQRISITNPQNIIDGTAKKYYFKLRNTGGPKGDKGDKGDTGSRGPQGEPGNAATVYVGSTTTLPVGQDATVENVGTQYNAVLNFGIPQGPRGPQGVKGDPGEPGQKGDTGPRGPQGERGSNATVYIGTTTTGEPGTQASVYNSGTESNAVLNFTIPRGDVGPSVPLVQETGNSTTKAMSQNATTEALNGKQNTLTAGSNITISGNTISAKDTTYTAGDNVQINGTVISATDTTYTAGANIQIQNGTISATDTTYTAGNGLNLNGTEFSADTDVLATKEDIAAYKTVSTPVTIEDGYYLKSLNEVSGSTGVQQFDAHGKNLLDMSKLSVGYLSSNGQPQNSHPLGEMYSGFIKVKPNTTYTFSIQKTDSNNDDWMAICEYKKPFMNSTYPMFITRSVVYLSRELTITTSSTTNYVALSARNLEQATEVQFEEGSKTAYEPYVGGIAQLDLYTNNILDTVTPSRLDGFIRNTGEIVSASDYYTCYIPCEPDTTYVVTKKCHIADRSAWSNMLKIGSSSIVPVAGGSVSSLVAEADGTMATYAINTTTSDAQFLVIFFARNRDYSEALAELSIYRASDAIDLSGSNKIIRDGSSWFLQARTVKTAITNSTLIRQLNELNDSGISLDGEIEAEVISPENGTPAIISLDYWTIYKGEKGEKGDTQDVTEIETDITELQRFVDYDKTVIGVNHRGYNQVAPENTLSAFRLSKQMGFNYVETDISFTSDGVAVCLHDNTIDRTSNGTGNINDLTYAQVLQYDFGSWKSPAYAGEKIPTFEQFIQLCRDLGLKPYIEIKNSATYTEAQIQSIVDLVERNGMRGKVTYISFNETYLGYVKNYDGEARLGYLADITSTTITTASGLRTSSNEVFIDASYSNATSAKVQLAMAAHLPVEVWTVDLESSIIGLDSYITGVTSDNLIAGKVLYESDIEE